MSAAWRRPPTSRAKRHFLRSLSLPLGALLAHSTARVKLESEVEALSRKLADRKLLDRAKGSAPGQLSMDRGRGLPVHLRRTSRQRRTPMRDIAREVIDLAGSRAMTRQTFLLAVPEALLAQPLAAETTRPKLLIVAAHPDDEYAFAATTYRLARELGWAADHVVITNGEAGYRYSALAEAIYGVGLTDERDGRSRLPAIRKRETLAAGKVLGIRRHYFLDQRDSGFATDAATAPTEQLGPRRECAPSSPACCTASATTPSSRCCPRPKRTDTIVPPPCSRWKPPRRCPRTAVRFCWAPTRAPPTRLRELFRGMPGQPLSRTRGERPAFVFNRDAHFGYRDALNYQIVVNWFIAEHKSQGLFQTDSGKHQLEQFWLFEASGRDADSRARELAARLTPAAHQVAAL